MAATTADEPLISTDPTQRLLTALGRFQRQVQNAESGNAGDGWADESMQQLISAIEIAIGEGWDDIREALTDTARILQTYEDAGIARNGLPFLQDSYEILCLMVGDLIVGNVRSGVLQKWRERYEFAVAAVIDEGLTLVEDDSAMGAMEDTDPGADPFAHATYPPELAGFEPETTDAGYVPLEEPMDEADPVEANAPDPVVDDAESEAGHAVVLDLGAESDGAPFDAPGDYQPGPASAEAPPSLDAVIGDSPRDATDYDFDAAPLPPVTPPAVDDMEDEVAFAELDYLTPEETLAPAPAETGADSEPDALEAEEEPEEDEGFILEPLAEERAAAPDVAASDPLEEEEDDDDGSDLYVPVIDTARLDEADTAWIGDAEPSADEEDAEGGVVEDLSNIEADDAAAELEGLAPGGDETDDAATESLSDLPQVAHEDAPPAPAPAAEASPAELLFATAQAAMRAGNVADAKRFALQLAANMARLESEQAKDDLKRLEERLAEDARSISEGEALVSDCQKSLQDHEWHIGERAGAIEEKGGELAALREDLGGIEAGIEDLDAQIRALQERRGEEAKRAAGVRESIAQAETEEGHLREDLGALEAARAEAEGALEAARARVVQLQEARQRHESDMRLAEAALREREAAVEDIDRTLGSAGGGSAEPQSDGLLF